MDGKLFMEGLDQLENDRGISKEEIIEALKVAIKKAYIKEIQADDSDAQMEVVISEEEVNIKVSRTVVEEVEIDYLEMSLEEAKKIKKNAKLGDVIVTTVDAESLRRATATAVKSILKQKIAEAEKRVLYETNKDKVNEMITGTVDRADDHGVVVTVGRSSVYLSRRDLIGDETFESGDTIRMFVSNVNAGDKEKGPSIKVSRSDPGFLRRLFEEEVTEIYNGTVIIKGIAREAGIRSKIAVYSNDPNIDAQGACIGINGIVIKKIVAQLGNSRDKEKVDVVPYSSNDGLFIVEALRPATVSYIHLDEEPDENGKKHAIAIVKDDQLSLAIGRKGANARVACRLTGYSIDIKEERDMQNEDLVGIEFKSVDEVREADKERIKKETYENYLAKVKSARAERGEPVTLSSGVEKAKPQQILDEDLVEDTPVKEVAQPKVEEVKVEEVPAKEESKVEVKTTTSIESLEAGLESEKKKSSFKPTHKSSKRPHQITDEELPHEELPKEEKSETKKQGMDIYSQEELAELEREELEDEDYIDNEEDEVNYDDYDEYYDDDDR